jgi:hypothetical protein
MLAEVAELGARRPIEASIIDVHPPVTSREPAVVSPRPCNNDTATRSSGADLRSVLSWRRAGSLQTGFFLLLASAAIWLFARRLPIEPVITSDSESYLNFSAIRPHGYPLFLAGYRWFWGGFAYLPATQAAIYLTGVAFLSIAVGRRLNSLLAGVGLFLAVYGYLDPNDVWSVLSEPLYSAATTAACGAFIFYVIRPGSVALIAASALLGTAVTCRNIGFALIPAFLGSVLLHNRRRGEGWARILVLAIAPIGVIGGIAALSNLLHNGSFSIGSAGGTSLLGKGLLLARPLPAGHRFAQLNWISNVAGPAREATTQIHNPFLKALVARQYYEYLRWFIAWPAFERAWPAWRMGDETERARLAGQLAIAFLLQDVGGYVGLISLDYLSLWTVPRWLTRSEELGVRAELTAVAPLPLLATFAQTREGQLEYYKIIPPAKKGALVYATRAAVAAFWAVTVLTAWFLFRHFRYLSREMPDLPFMVVGVHSVYIGTALVEAGLERYIWPTWPVLLAAPLLGAFLVMRTKGSALTVGEQPRNS